MGPKATAINHRMALHILIPLQRTHINLLLGEVHIHQMPLTLQPLCMGRCRLSRQKRMSWRMRTIIYMEVVECQTPNHMTQ